MSLCDSFDSCIAGKSTHRVLVECPGRRLETFGAGRRATRRGRWRRRRAAGDEAHDERDEGSRRQTRWTNRRADGQPRIPSALAARFFVCSRTILIVLSAQFCETFSAATYVPLECSHEPPSASVM